MFVTNPKITTIMLTLACGIACLAGHSAMQAGQSVPIVAPVPKDRDDTRADADAKRAADFDKMFPDGVSIDFGVLKRGVVVKHSFRIVNTTGRPLQIIPLIT